MLTTYIQFPVIMPFAIALRGNVGTGIEKGGVRRGLFKAIAQHDIIE
ncbi:hypothetical protein WJM97_13575 [Okeanomitos corallinicola TIOX110]|uniref:Uncharacterized protein n=1 Tax=Okeanomitos corallinicola TIOX110 TaxID=3133117 RepID=A0ABZ2UM37_9CYAN